VELPEQIVLSGPAMVSGLGSLLRIHETIMTKRHKRDKYPLTLPSPPGERVKFPLARGEEILLGLGTMGDNGEFYPAVFSAAIKGRVVCNGTGLAIAHGFHAINSNTLCKEIIPH